MKRNLWKVLFAATAIAGLAAGSAQAQLAVQDTATMEVQVEIVDGCTVNLIGGPQVRFSNRTQIINDHLTREVNVNCTIGGTWTGSPSSGAAGYELRLPASMSGWGKVDDREMHNAAGNAVYYSVRTMNTCSTPLWGDGNAGTQVINGSFPTAQGGNSHQFNVCMDRAYNVTKGVAVDNPPLGLYADTLQIQLWY